MKTGILILVVLTTIYTGGCATISKTTFANFQKKPANALRVATYNLNWGNGVALSTSPIEVIKTIQKINADIILLQETTHHWKKLINQHIKNYPYRKFLHYVNAGGFAVLSHYPLTTTVYLPPKFGWHPIWIFTVKTPTSIIQFLNVHLTPPLASEGNIGFLAYALFTTKQTRLQEIKYAYQLLNHQQPTIIAGDFNEGDYGSAVKFLSQEGFLDAYAGNYNMPYTWYWQMGIIVFAERLDRIFYTSNLQLIRVQILHEGSSDHFPVVADFKKFSFTLPALKTTIHID